METFKFQLLQLMEYLKMEFSDGNHIKFKLDCHVSIMTIGIVVKLQSWMLIRIKNILKKYQDLEKKFIY
jgi:hypothetical protein